MPKFDIQNSESLIFIHRIVENLRSHHGVKGASLSDTDQKMEPVDALEELFARFDDGTGVDWFDEPSAAPSRYIPARQLLTAIRLGAAFGGFDTYDRSRLCGAITVICDIDPADMGLVKDALKIGLPQSDWQLVFPDIIDGKTTTSAQAKFDALIADCVERIEPVLILQPRGISLPRHLLATDPAILPLAAHSRDILTTYLSCSHLGDQIPDTEVVRSALPGDADLAALGTLDICAALRAPTPHVAAERLNRMIGRNATAMGPRLEDFGGETPALTAARRLADDLQAWKSDKAAWRNINRSLLLYGPPGTGKSWLARAIGNTAGVNVINASFATWQACGHLGDMLRAMTESFAEARRLAPSVLIIDEVDAVGSRSDVDRHASNYRAQVINAFLGQMDSLAKEEGVFVIGTCNHIDRMDPAVTRAGRFDLKILVPLPDAEAIYAILRHHLHEDLADAELKDLSHNAVGQSAADIDAAIRAVRSDARHARKLMTVGMLRTRMGIVASKMDDAVRWRIAVHEAGHAVVGAALNLGSIQSMSITCNGGEILRTTKASHSLLSDIEAEMTYSLAGRAAEQLVLGEVSAGAGGPAASDLARATKWAIEVETTYGLGFEGLVWHPDPEAVHRQTPAIRDRVRQRLNRLEKRAGDLLAEHRNALLVLARELAQKRFMRAADIQRHLQVVAKSAATPAPQQRDLTPVFCKPDAS